MSQQSKEMKRFLDEWSYANGGRNKFTDLPDPSAISPLTRDIRMPREVVVKFLISVKLGPEARTSNLGRDPQQTIVSGDEA